MAMTGAMAVAKVKKNVQTVLEELIVVQLQLLITIRVEHTRIPLQLLITIQVVRITMLIMLTIPAQVEHII